MRVERFELHQGFERIKLDLEDGVLWTPGLRKLGFFRGGRPLYFEKGEKGDGSLWVGRPKEAARMLRLISACLQKELQLLPLRYSDDPHVYKIVSAWVGTESIIRARFTCNGHQVTLQPGDRMVRSTSQDAVTFLRGGEPLILGGYPAEDDPYELRAPASFPMALLRLVCACSGLAVVRSDTERLGYAFVLAED